MKKLRGIILGGLREFETKLKEEKKPRSLRQLICAIAVQKVETNPFPEDILVKTKDKLRMALKAGGYGDGLPQAGDVVQHFDVRLIQGLLAACKDQTTISENGGLGVSGWAHPPGSSHGRLLSSIERASGSFKTPRKRAAAIGNGIIRLWMIMQPWFSRSSRLRRRKA